MTIKIALVTSADLSTVQGTTEAHYVTKYLSSKYNVHVYSPHDPGIQNISYHKIPSGGKIPALLQYNFLLLPYLLYHWIRNDFDLIYTYKGFLLPPYLTSKLSDTNWIVDFQTKPTMQNKEFSTSSSGISQVTNVYYLMFDALYRLTLPQSSEIITLSKSISKHLATEYDVDPSKLAIVPLGVDTKRFKRTTGNRRVSDPLNLVYIGSIGPERGFERCIDALSSLESSIHFHLVGDGPDAYLRELRTKIRSNGLENDVTWHGYIPHEDLTTLLSDMDVAISPLPNHDSYEVSSPAKVFEYLSMELPIVCTDILAHQNLLENGSTGFFYDPGSTTSLKHALQDVANLNSSEWSHIRQAARDTALEHDWSVRFEDINRIIQANVPSPESR